MLLREAQHYTFYKDVHLTPFVSPEIPACAKRFLSSWQWNAPGPTCYCFIFHVAASNEANMRANCANVNVNVTAVLWLTGKELLTWRVKSLFKKPRVLTWTLWTKSLTHYHQQALLPDQNHCFSFSWHSRKSPHKVKSGRKPHEATHS